MGTIKLSTELCALRRSKRVKIDQKMPETYLHKDKPFKQLLNAQNTICAAPKSFLSLSKICLSKYYFQKNVNWSNDPIRSEPCSLAVAPSISLHYLVFTLRSQLTVCSQICKLCTNSLLHSYLSYVVWHISTLKMVQYQPPTGRELKWTRYIRLYVSVLK